jgi:AraC family transcriptional regulator, positive regulator of tynA and feaB
MNNISKGRNPTILSSDEWISTSRMVSGLDPVGVDPGKFVGWVHPVSLYGLQAFDWACNIPRIDRTQQHACIDCADYYSAIFPLMGHSTIDHNDAQVELKVGDVILADATRPGTVFRESGVAQHVWLHLPRRELVSHLGFEPVGGLVGHRTIASRLLFQLISETVADQEELSNSAEPHMRLAIYDLLAATFSTSKQLPASPHTDKLFASICHMIRERFADPLLCPSSVAANVGVSVRYLQKLFTARGMTCSDFIQSLRLDHASRLIARRAALQNDQPLGDIARASGFLDYAHFSRKFRARFGHPPSLHLTSRG